MLSRRPPAPFHPSVRRGDKPWEGAVAVMFREIGRVSPRTKHARRMAPNRGRLRRSVREFGVAIAAVVLSWWLLPEEQVTGAAASIVIGLIALVLMPHIEYSYYWLAEPRSRTKRENKVLRREIKRLQKRLADPLAVSFKPRTVPYEEDYTGRVRRSTGEEVQRKKKVFRVCVKNTSPSEVRDVVVRLDFEPPRPRMSELVLHQMHDNPGNTDEYRTAFCLSGFDRQFIDVVFKSSLDNVAHVYHVVPRLEQTVGVGDYDVVLSVRAHGVEPKTWRFGFSVKLGGLDFWTQD